MKEFTSNDCQMTDSSLPKEKAMSDLKRSLARAEDDLAAARKHRNELRGKLSAQMAEDPGYQMFCFSTKFKQKKPTVREYKYVGLRVGSRVYLTGSVGGAFANWAEFVHWCRENLVEMSDVYELESNGNPTPCPILPRTLS